MKTCNAHPYRELNQLCTVDGDFHELIKVSNVPPMLSPEFSAVSFDDLFATLARKVIHQQLSTKVASVIEGRLNEACGGVMIPSKVLDLTQEDLSNVGLSRSKQRAITELASKFLTDPDWMREVLLSDDDLVVAKVTSLFGFGHWSAQMFLLFDLGRHDIWAPLDLGVRKGYQRLKGLEDVPSHGDLKELSKVFSPVGSMATWYLWRALEL